MSSQKIAKNTAFLLMASVGQKLLSFVYFTILSYKVGLGGSANYFLATSFTTMFAVFVDLGLSNVLVREVAKNPERAGVLLKNVLAVKALMAAGVIALIALVSYLLGYDGVRGTMIAIAAVVMLLDNIHLVFYAVMRGKQNLRYEAIGVVSGQLITILSGIAFIMLGMPLPFLIVALLLGSTWNVLWSWNRIKKVFNITPAFSFDKTVIRSLLTVTIPFALAGIFSRIYSSIDSVMLSKLTDEASLGWYGVAYKIAFAFQFLPMTFAAALYPAMSAYAGNDKKQLPGLLEKSIEYLLLIVAPIVTGIVVLAEPLVARLYGDEFSGTVAPLKILMFSLIFAFLYWPAGSLLNATDRQAKNTIIMAITMVVNIVANAFLIPRLGAVGAAYAALLGNIVLCSLAYIATYRLAPFSLMALFGRIWRIAAAALTMGFAVTFAAPHVPLVIDVLIGAITYPVAAFAFGAISTKDIAWLRETMKV